MNRVILLSKDVSLSRFLAAFNGKLDDIEIIYFVDPDWFPENVLAEVYENRPVGTRIKQNGFWWSI